MDDEDFTSYWGYWGPKAIHRSLYIEEVLYTISNGMIKMNDIESLEDLASLELN
jgi:hypothetical protein